MKVVTSTLLCRAAFLPALLALLAAPVQAEEPGFSETWRFSLGVMKNGGDGAVASTYPDLPQDRLTFSDLGLDDDEHIFWADIDWQFAPRWELGFTLSSFSTDGLNVDSSGGNFEGVDWEAGTFLASNLDVKVYILDLTRDLLKSETGHLGIGLGVHAADLEFELVLGEFISVGGEEAEFTPIGFEEASVLAPLPNVTLAGGLKIAENVYLEGKAGWMSLSYDKYDGDLYSFRGGLLWRPWSHIGFGVGYQYIDVDVEIEQRLGEELWDLTFDGPVAFVSVGFR